MFYGSFFHPPSPCYTTREICSCIQYGQYTRHVWIFRFIRVSQSPEALDLATTFAFFCIIPCFFLPHTIFFFGEQILCRKPHLRYRAGGNSRHLCCYLFPRRSTNRKVWGTNVTSWCWERPAILIIDVIHWFLYFTSRIPNLRHVPQSLENDGQVTGHITS